MFQMRRKRLERKYAQVDTPAETSRRVSDAELFAYMKKTELLPHEFDS